MDDLEVICKALFLQVEQTAVVDFSERAIIEDFDQRFVISCYQQIITSEGVIFLARAGSYLGKYTMSSD